MKQFFTFFTWIIIIISCTFLYGQKDKISDLKNEFLALIFPEKGYYKNNIAEYYVSNNGHFVIATTVNNQQINFLLDTGASSIVLTRNDAIKANIDVDSLKYDIPISTANGTSYIAYAIIQKLQVANKVFNNLPVAVTKSGLDQSLLGMSFLKRVSSYSINDNKLTISF